MSHIAAALEHRTWTRDGFLVSTDPTLIPINALTRAFDSPDLYWAKGLPEPAMREMLDNSLSFGLYSPTPQPPPAAEAETADTAGPAAALHEIATHVQTSTSRAPKSTSTAAAAAAPAEPSLIGYARAITDRVTFFYLTDVYVLPEWQGQGLGNWLIGCVQEVVEELPFLRRSMCIVGHGAEQRSQFYHRLMKMEPLTPPAFVLNYKGPGCSF